jgi:hypothetical protein
MQAYAHIVERGGTDKGLDKFITKLPAVLGRTTTPNATEGEQICIGPTEPTLSRYHAVVQWNESVSKLEIACLSKNGMVVDNKTYSKSDPPVILNQKSSVRMGSVKFHLITGTIKIDPVSHKPLPGHFEILSQKKEVNTEKKSYFGKQFKKSYC